MTDELYTVTILAGKYGNFKAADNVDNVESPESLVDAIPHEQLAEI
jgi:hypothetical protein